MIAGLDATKSIVDGDRIDWIFEVKTPAANVAFFNMAIRNGLTAIGVDGGGIYSFGDTTATGAAFTGNTAGAAGLGGTGGAIYYRITWHDNGWNTFSGNSPDDVSS